MDSRDDAAVISLEEGNGYVNKMRKIILSFPEVETVVSQHGRPQDGTDATGFFNAEFFVPLKPLNQWRPRVYKDDLTDQINDALQVPFPGVSFNFSHFSLKSLGEIIRKLSVTDCRFGPPSGHLVAQEFFGCFRESPQGRSICCG